MPKTGPRTPLSAPGLSELNSEVYHLILDAISDAVLLLDQEDCILLANNRAHLLLGFEQGALIGQPLTAFFTTADPQGAGPCRGSLRRNDGPPLTVDLQLTPLGATGLRLATVGAPATLRDANGASSGASTFANGNSDVVESTALLNRRIREQQAVAALGQFALQTGDLDALFARATRTLAETLGVEFARVLALDPAGRSFTSRSHYDPLNRIPQQVAVAVEASHAGYTLSENKPVLLTDVNRETRFAVSPQLRQAGVASGLAVPIGGAHGPYGVLSTHSTSAGRFDAAEVHFVQSLANVLADAIERARVEAEARLAQERFAKAFRASPDAMIVCRLSDGTIIDVNERWPQITGYPIQDVIGTSATNLNLQLRGEAHDPLGERLLREGYVHDAETTIRRRDGELRAVAISAESFAVGSERMMLITLRDVTERKRSEARLRQAVLERSAVTQLSQLALQGTTLQTLLDSAVKVLGETLDLAVAFVAEALPDSGEFVMHALYTGNLPPLQRVIPVGPSFSAYTMRMGRTVILDDAASETRFGLSPIGAAHKLRSGIATPIYVQGNPYGVIVAFSQLAYRFGEDDVDLIQSLANVIGVAMERQRSEDGLRASQERFAKAFRSIPDAISLTRLSDGLIVDVNDRWPEMFGYTRADVIGRTTSEIGMFMDLADRQAMLASLQRDGFLHDYELRIRGKAGAPIDVMFSTEILEIDGEPHQLAIIRDVTRRKQTETELLRRARQQEAVSILGQRALEASSTSDILSEAVALAAAGLDCEFGFLLELDADGDTLLWREALNWPAELTQESLSLATARAFGVDPLDETPILLNAPPAGTLADRAPIFAVLGALSAMSVVVPGEVRPFGVIGVQSRHNRAFSEQDIYFLRAVANVLAAGHARERTLVARAAQVVAEEANRAKDEFLSRMSHELRTPLNAILGFSQILRRRSQAPDQSEYLGYISDAGKHLLDLINEILDISRIESGRLRLELNPVSLLAVVRESVEMVRPLAASQGIELQVDIAGMARRVVADRQRLKQVLVNLLSNAIKYNCLDGSVTLHSSVGESGLRVGVADTGPGISREDQARLFKPFERLGAERSGVEGTGLGLALSKLLIEAMGGAISLESTPGQGSTFWLDLPLAAADSGPAAGENSAPAATGQASHVGTLLYIEDNRTNVQLVEGILAWRPGLQLLLADRGERGLELARAHLPDLILLDLHLPDIGGHEILQRLRADPASAAIPVVILSADALPQQIAALRAAGAADYLTKPLDVEQFLALLDRMMPAGKG